MDRGGLHPRRKMRRGKGEERKGEEKGVTEYELQKGLK